MFPLPLISSLLLAAQSHTSLQVLFENDHIAVVAKPGNVPCHHLEIQRGKRKRTLIQGNASDDDAVLPMIQRARLAFPQHKDSIHLVHRLDAPTSGCLILAFSPAAAREASDALARGQKTYYALCRGNGESLRQRGIFLAEGDVKDSRGRAKSGAKTVFECLYGTDGPPRRCCLVRCQPKTGYYHQIRQHISRENHPIIGENRHRKDIKENRFWRQELGLLPQSRICLHCHQIKLRPDDAGDEAKEFQYLPADGLDVTCPLPDDIRKLVELTTFAEEAFSLIQ
jgi:23S rRNA-/tRNA-specific pseudouridylate synthase